jgi:hypothetical protein
VAELVAALSLGVDLGFGQPMEHVLRQCLIALRLAERVGLDDEQRADTRLANTLTRSTIAAAQLDGIRKPHLPVARSSESQPAPARNAFTSVANSL